MFPWLKQQHLQYLSCWCLLGGCLSLTKTTYRIPVLDIHLTQYLTLSLKLQLNLSWWTHPLHFQSFGRHGNCLLRFWVVETRLVCSLILLVEAVCFFCHCLLLAFIGWKLIRYTCHKLAVLPVNLQIILYRCHSKKSHLCCYQGNLRGTAEVLQ